MRSALRAPCVTLAFALLVALPGAARQPSLAAQQPSPQCGQQPQGQQPPPGEPGQRQPGKRGQKPEMKAPQLPEAQRRLLPDTPPGKLLGEWLAICGRPSTELMTKWRQDNVAERFLRQGEPRTFGRSTPAADSSDLKTAS